MPITLVRHTAVDVVEGLCYGQSEVSLKHTFPKEADKVISQLHQLPPIDHLISSPLSRCINLAERIGEAFQLIVNLDDRLKELNLGVWELQLWSDIDREEVDIWMSNLDNPPHQGESLRALHHRVHQALDDYRGDEHWVCVTHAGVIKAALNQSEESKEGWYKGVEYGEVVQL